MTIRTFWTIFIKILGIWLTLGCLSAIPVVLSPIFFASTSAIESMTFALIPLIFLILFYFLTLWLFVFKTAWLIDKLHLDKGFIDDKIDLNVQLSTVLNVATIVIGGLMFIDSLPELCRQAFIFYQQKNVFIENPTTGWIIFFLAKTIIGYLLMTNSKTIITLINKQTAKQDHNQS
jgi:hypothetical protein